MLIMTKILKKEQLNGCMFRYRLKAPIIAKKHQAGQFVILRVTQDGERIPLTIANSYPTEGWIEIVFQTVGYTTQDLATLNVGDNLADLAGPLGCPTHIEDFGQCVCIGGGVGIAPLYPIVSELKKAGNLITTILGARTKNLIILEDEMKSISDRVLIATDDGSYGHRGFVSDVLKKLLDQCEHFDFAMVIGPPIMMKVTSGLALQAGIQTYVSLNPIMIDGTGMCGGCRVTINGETRFACVDGPEFNAAGIDWDSLIKRLNSYQVMESSCKTYNITEQ
jgi:ferredoxin--NADP+ reductase